MTTSVLDMAEQVESSVEPQSCEQGLRIRGLPWSCTEQELRTFLAEASEGVNIMEFIMTKDGRPSGEAYVSFNDEANYNAALKKDQDYMGHRYVEVFPATSAEMWHMISTRGSKSGSAGGTAGAANYDGIVRLRGLPFSATKEEVVDWFAPLEVRPEGVTLVEGADGRLSGEAFVQLVDPHGVEKAMEKHMTYMNRRYIEVFRSSADDHNRALRKMGQHMWGGAPQQPTLPTDWFDKPSGLSKYSTGGMGSDYGRGGGGKYPTGGRGGGHSARPYDRPGAGYGYGNRGDPSTWGAGYGMYADPYAYSGYGGYPQYDSYGGGYRNGGGGYGGGGGGYAGYDDYVLPAA